MSQTRYMEVYFLITQAIISGNGKTEECTNTHNMINIP